MKRSYALCALVIACHVVGFAARHGLKGSRVSALEAPGASAKPIPHLSAAAIVSKTQQFLGKPKP